MRLWLLESARLAAKEGGGGACAATDLRIVLRMTSLDPRDFFCEDDGVLLLF